MKAEDIVIICHVIIFTFPSSIFSTPKQELYDILRQINNNEYFVVIKPEDDMNKVIDLDEVPLDYFRSKKSKHHKTKDEPEFDDEYYDDREIAQKTFRYMMREATETAVCVYKDVEPIKIGAVRKIAEEVLRKHDISRRHTKYLTKMVLELMKCDYPKCT